MVKETPAEPKLIAYGTFNVYDIDGKAYLYDHIKHRFFRDPSRDYLIKKSGETVEYSREKEEDMKKFLDEFSKWLEEHPEPMRRLMDWVKKRPKLRRKT